MSAPNIKEIEWAISELENQESSKSNYALLAALYTCRDNIRGAGDYAVSYSSAPAPQEVPQYGSSEFLQVVSGVDSNAAWLIMDELMETLRVVNPKVYESVMRKLRNI